MIGALLGDFWPYLIAAGGAVAAFVAAYLKGRGDGKAGERRKLDEAYRKTRERMDDADMGDPDPATLRGWLRERGQR